MIFTINKLKVCKIVTFVRLKILLISTPETLVGQKYMKERFPVLTSTESVYTSVQASF